MIRLGYTLMTEQSGPSELVRYATAAEQAGFDFAVSSDHYSPWLASQGHAPHAWTMLGAVAPDAALIDDWQHARRRPVCRRPAARSASSRSAGIRPDQCTRPGHRQFRWFGGGWPVDAELRTTDAFAAASRFVTPPNVADQIRCGPDLDGIVAAVREYAAA